MKTGLVLEGGAMRGMYTAGVLDVMMENSIWADGAVGVSAGAVFGCNYKSRQIGRTIRYNKKYGRDPRYAGFYSLLKTGDYFGTEFCYHEIPEKLDPFDSETFQKNPTEFYVVGTDVTTGKAVYHKCTTGTGKDLDWFRASASMPLLSNIVEVDGYKLLDGGIADSIPIEWFRSIGYKRNIIILTRDKSYRKKKNKMIPLFHVMLRRYPEVAKAMKNRHLMYNRELRMAAALEKAGKALVIRPSKPITISRTENDPEKLEEVYQLGRKDGMANLEKMRIFLKNAKAAGQAVKDTQGGSV